MMADSSRSGNAQMSTRLLTSAIVECVQAAGEIDRIGGADAAERAMASARALVLGITIEEYHSLEEKCCLHLQSLLTHVRKYGAVRNGNAILMTIRDTKVGISVPADKNLGLLTGTPARIIYEVITMPLSGRGEPGITMAFDSQTKIARFIASMHRG